MNNIELKKATINEISQLQAICKELYPIWFGSYWEKNGLELYLEDQFGTNSLQSDLMGKHIEYYFIYLGEEAVGFLKINGAVPFEDFKIGAICELEKMYVFPKFKGLGIGTHALNNIIQNYRKRDISKMMLDVIETNKNAIAFYEKCGFKFHSKTKVAALHFKESLNGLNRMVLDLK